AGVFAHVIGSFSDTAGTYQNNTRTGLWIEDVTSNVTLVRTTAENNDFNDNNLGDGVIIARFTLGVAMGGDLLVQGGSYSDTGGAADHQERGIVVDSIAGSMTFEDSAGPVQSVTVTGNESHGLLVVNGGTSGTFTNGSYSSNGGDGMNLSIFSAAVTWTGVTAADNSANGLNATDLSGTISGSSFGGNARGILYSSAGGTLTIGTTTIDANNGAGDGAGINVIAGSLTLNAGTTVTDNESTAGSGGGIAFASAGALSLTSTVVSGNTAAVDGGGIHISAGTGHSIASSTIADNTATAGSGGGIHVAAGDLTLDGATIGGAAPADRNTAGQDGGGINLAGGGLAFAGAASTISFNSATRDGGGISVASTFTNALTLTNLASVVENVASRHGGGVNLAGGVSATWTTPTLERNHADTGRGGALYVAATFAAAETLTLDGTAVGGSGNANTAQDGGGIAWESPGTLKLQDATVSFNTVTQDGGGVYQSAGTIDVDPSHIDSNSADGDGGGAAIVGGIFELTDGSTVNDNSADGSGGGIHIEGGFSHVITDSTIAGNTADAEINGTGDGGGVNVAAAFASTLTITNSTIGGATALAGNSAVNGGGLALAGGGTVSLVHSAVASNVATGNGGGLVQTGGTLDVVNSTVSSNSGAGVHVFGGTANLNHATVARNSGTGVTRTAGTVNATQSLFAENTGTNFSGTVTSGGHNLFEDAAVTGAAASDLLNADALLANLALYGGTTLNHALLPGSDALDAVLVDALALATDQRGIARPQPVAGRKDIGAFESRGFIVTLVSPTVPAPAGDTKYRALIEHTFVAESGDVCVPIDFTATIRAVAVGVEPIEGGRVTFTSDATAGVAGSVDVPVVIGAPNLANEATVSANIQANDTESAAGSSYDLKVRAGGDWVSAEEWELFNQIVTKIVASGEPQTTRSGDVIRFASAPNAEVGLVYTLFDQEVTAANEAASIVRFNNEHPNDQVTLDPVKVNMIAPNIVLAESAIFNVSAVPGSPDGAGNVMVLTDDCGEAAFAGLKIYQSSFTRLYRIQAAFTNPDGTPVTLVSEPFRILPRKTEVIRPNASDPKATRLRFFSVRRSAPFVTIRAIPPRGFVRIIVPFRRVQNLGGVNQIGLRALDAVNEFGATILASNWDGPIDMTIPQFAGAAVDAFGRWQLVNPSPGAPRTFFGSQFIVRAIATGGEAVVLGVSPAGNRRRFFVRATLTLDPAAVLAVGNRLTPNAIEKDTIGPLTRVLEARHRRK
ncbi:MAG: hypothetical protein L0Y71_22060, partial [Gemmataceae bacterium]|nr:hypothetical protein [Gemmataceae bacterium]